MPVRFVLGRAGTGKTYHCLTSAAAALAEPDDARLILLVPEQASFEMERALAMMAPGGGFSRAEVLSFSRLVRRLFADTGGEPEALRSSGRRMKLRAAAVRHPELLAPFGRAANTPGFFEQVSRVIEQLLAEATGPDALREAAERIDDLALQARLASLASLFEAYEQDLGNEYVDPAARIAAARARLDNCTWLDGARIWVDGFAGFTGQELAFLVGLAKRAQSVDITLLLDPATIPASTARPPRPSLFTRTERTHARVRDALAAARVPVDDPVVLDTPHRFARTPSLRALERGLAGDPYSARAAPSESGASPEPSADPPGAGASATRRRTPATGRQLSLFGEGSGPERPRDGRALSPTDPPAPATDTSTSDTAAGDDRPTAVPPPTSLRVLACQSHRDEMEQAARWIRQQVAESAGRRRFRDFALICRDLTQFAGLASEVLREYEVPFFLDQRRPLAHHALARFASDLLEAARTNLSGPPMVRLLRSGLLPVRRGHAEALEEAVVMNAVRGLDAWSRAAWCFESHSRPRDELDQARRSVATGLADLTRLAQADAASGRTWTETLYATLERLKVAQRLRAWVRAARANRQWERAEVHRTAWEALIDVLDEAHAMLGDTRLAADDFASALTSALDEQTIGLAPPTLDQVLVGAIDRTRHPDVRCAWIFGFNEGIFPAAPPNEPLFGARDRLTLGDAGLEALEPRAAEVMDEPLLGYIACTRASDMLRISYAAVGLDGEPAHPSPLLEGLRTAIPDLRVERPEADAPPVTLSEVARGCVASDDRVGGRYRALRAALARDRNLSTRLDWLLRGEKYSNDVQPVGNYRRPEDRPGVVWAPSASELDAYIQCPFKHFAARGLRLAERRVPTPPHLELGRIAHEVLAAALRNAIARKKDARLDDDAWLECLEAASRTIAAGIEVHDLGQRRPVMAALLAGLEPFLRELTLVHAERWRRGTAAPLVCEQPFGEPEEPTSWPALELSLDHGERVHVRGRIDRVDVCVTPRGRFLMVYDYKSTVEKRLDARFLTQKRLQAFIYLRAAQQVLEKKGFRPGGVFTAPLYPDPGVIDTGYYEDANADEQRMYLYKPRGIVATEIVDHLDRGLDTAPSPVIHAQRTQKGAFRKSSDVMSARELELRLDLLDETVRAAAMGLAQGEIPPAPLYENKTLACRYCDFQPVCRFEQPLNQTRVPLRHLPVLPEHAPNEADSDAEDV